MLLLAFNNWEKVYVVATTLATLTAIASSIWTQHSLTRERRRSQARLVQIKSRPDVARDVHGETIEIIPNHIVWDISNSSDMSIYRVRFHSNLRPLSLKRGSVRDAQTATEVAPLPPVLGGCSTWITLDGNASDPRFHPAVATFEDSNGRRWRRDEANRLRDLGVAHRRGLLRTFRAPRRDSSVYPALDEPLADQEH